jgi:hypothetical protein
MANFGEIQNLATDQALREQNQQLRKQLEYMKTQMQALMANLGNMNAQMLTLMETGARIEATLRSSSDSAEGSKTSQKKDKGIQQIVINATGTTQFAHKAPDRGNYKPQNYQPAYYSQPAPAPHVFIQAPQQRQVKIQRQNNPPPQQYPPLPVSQAEIYKQLVAEGLLSPLPTRPWGPPFPAWYNPNAKCAYHSNVAGHSIENCAKLRQKIYELISAGNIELNLVENEPFKVNTAAPKEGVNSLWVEEEDQKMEQICWPGDRKEDVHVAVIGDGTALPHI